ncbi:MAG: SRPBCC domain-containing protein [Bacteroidetes bacterium]|nr:SRPBCC domain-containing protein [Bacteroidota bacterium]
MPESIKLTAAFLVKPNVIYNAWLNGKEHTAMTGGKATASKEVGGNFTAWEKYIKGKNLELVKNKRILQSWRSQEFPENSLSSLLLIKLDETPKGTKLTLVHSEIPDKQGNKYKKGWVEHYFVPMKKYFNKQK